jgi:membrane fusion protein, adhesin transport system
MKTLLHWIKKAANHHFFDLRQNQYLPQSAKLEDNLGTRYVVLSIFTVCCLVLILIIWSTQVTLSETTDATGELFPEKKIQIVQHLDGGIVDKIYVENGDEVKKHQVLFVLNDTAALAELEESRAKEVSSLIDAERLRAYLKGDKYQFSENMRNLLESGRFGKYSKESVDAIYNEEKILLRVQRLARDDKRSVIKAQIAKEVAAIAELKLQQKLLQDKLGLLRKEKGMYDTLKDKQFFSQREYLKVQRDINGVQTELLQLHSKMTAAKRTHQELSHKLNQLNSGLRENARTELDKINAELLQTRHKIKRLENKVDRHTIRSPVAGRVKGLDVTPGSVIAAGKHLLEVIPQQTRLVADVRIPASEIGHIALGDPVNLKVMTYDFARYGAVKGVLEQISAGSFEPDDRNDTPYYRATVRLESQALTRGSRKFALKSGMTVQASIVTGHKSLFEYIVKPVKVSLDKGFHER